MSAWTIPSYAEWAVPGYAEERLLGHGLSGRVVVAVNEATGQRVAIKYLDANLVRDTEFLREFRSATERLMSLDGAHMVRLFDYVEQPGQGAAIVMELVDGVSLREMLARRGPLDAAAALVVLKDSLLGLAAAHSRRVPHRDLKPDNVLIDTRGWCKLTDCGVAVKTDKVPVAGTPAYMAPELWNWEPNVPATDIYAATAVLCESVTGRPPFPGRLGELRHQHESAQVPLDRFDQPLRDLIAWGMAKNPADRPPSAHSFVTEVEARAAAAYGPYWEDQGRRQLAERAAALLPLLAGGGGSSAAATRLARRKMTIFVSAVAVAMVALVAVGAVALAGSSGKTQLSSTSAAAFATQVTVTPPVAAVSKCTTATTFAYSGTVTATKPGTLSYRWLYSSGKQGPVQTASFTVPGHRQVSGGTVKASAAGGGWAEIKMLSPVASTSNQAAYKLLCGTANSEIALSASVQPAAQTVSSCAAAAPSLTATGSITSKKAGTVSYYWALANGQDSAAGTVTFTGPGTKTLAPLTITPPALPATGQAVLVVTKPVAATSSPATYTVSCKAAAAATSSAAAHATSSASSRTSASTSASPSKTTASPTPTATTPTPTPTTTSPTPTPTTSSPTPTPTPTTSSPTPTPTTSSATDTATNTATPTS